MHVQAVPQAVVAGHICLDITPAFCNREDVSLSQLLQPGRLVRVGAADIHTGGCVANTGLALQKLGVPTRLIAKVGQDSFSEILRGLLSAEGAECALSEETGCSTSYSVVIAPPGIDRIFLHNPGANEAFSDTDVPDSLLSGARLFHFGYPPLMRRMCQNGGEELLRLFRRVKALGLATSMDMAAVDPASEAAQVDWLDLFPKLLPLVDFFLPSAEELCFLLDRERHTEWLARAKGRDITETLDIERDIAPLAECLIRMGCAVAVIKCGARGMYYRSAGEKAIVKTGLSLSAIGWASQEGYQPAYRPRKVVSATGAGDTSIAAFLASALEGCPLEKCVRRAAATGACCVEAYDALSGLEPFSALDSRIASGWEVQR